MTFSREEEEAAYVHSSMWAQLAERCGATRSTEALHEFLALYDSITQFASVQTLNAYANGGERGSEYQQRLMRDDYSRGVVDTYRRIYSDMGQAVPAWVEVLAAEIEQRRTELRSDTPAAVRPDAVARSRGDVVH